MQNLNNKDPGEISIGGLNSKYADISDVTFEDTANANQWVVPVKEISIGDVKAELHEFMAEVATAENHMRLRQGIKRTNLCR